MNMIPGTQVLEYKEYLGDKQIAAEKIMKLPILKDPIRIQIDISDTKLQYIKQWCKEYKYSIYDAITILFDKGVETLDSYRCAIELGEISENDEK